MEDERFLSSDRTSTVVVVPENVLDAISNDDLRAITIYLHMICGRSKLPTKGRARAKLCFLGARLDLENQQRGLPIPTAPFHAPAKQAL